MRMTFDLSISNEFSPGVVPPPIHLVEPLSAKNEYQVRWNMATDTPCSCLLSSFVYLFLWPFVDYEIVDVSRKPSPVRWLTTAHDMTPHCVIIIMMYTMPMHRNTHGWIECGIEVKGVRSSWIYSKTEVELSNERWEWIWLGFVNNLNAIYPINSGQHSD